MAEPLALRAAGRRRAVSVGDRILLTFIQPTSGDSLHTVSERHGARRGPTEGSCLGLRAAVIIATEQPPVIEDTRAKLSTCCGDATYGFATSVPLPGAI